MDVVEQLAVKATGTNLTWTKQNDLELMEYYYNNRPKEVI